MQVKCLCGELMPLKKAVGARWAQYFYFECSCGAEAALAVSRSGEMAGGFCNSEVYGQLVEGDEGMLEVKIMGERRGRLPRFPYGVALSHLLGLDKPVKVAEGVYDMQEGQWRVAINGDGVVEWACYLQDGDMEDYLWGCKGIVPRPMLKEEIIHTLKMVGTSLAWGQEVANAIASSAE